MEALLNPRMISEAAGDCVDLFHRCLFQSQPLRHGPASALLEDQYGRFNIWTSNFGVFAPDHASMDYRLREATDIKDLVVRLLETLLGHIEQICGISSDDATSNDRAYIEVGPLGGSESILGPLEEPLAAVAEDISILHKLSNTIRKASAETESHNAKAATTFEITDADGNDISQPFKDGFAAPLLKTKFPDACESIRARLASAMLLRRRRILYNKSRYAAGPTKNLPEPTAAEFPNPALKLVETQLISESMTEGFKPSRLLSTQNRVLSQARTATTLDPERFRKASTPSHVSTARSIPLVQDDELDYPLIPKPVADLEVICPYCFLVLLGDEATDFRKWREHVKNDLDPYVCLFEVCDQPDVLYKHSQPWLKHMRREHMLQWRCPAKPHRREVFQNRAEFEDHMRQHHRGIISEKQLALLAERSLRSNGPTFTSCPLCGLFETNVARMESHVAQHLRSLALESLPWPDDVEDTIRTTIADYSEHEVTSMSHEVMSDAPERPRDKSASYEENSSVFEKSLGAIRTEEWGFLGDILLGHSNDNASLLIDPDPILKAFAERLKRLNGTALQEASFRGDEKVVQMLLDRDVDVNAQDGRHGGALYAASSRGHKTIVQMLLEKDVDVNAPGGQYGTALQAASAGGNKQIVQMLLDQDVDVNAQGGQFGNALQAASWIGHKKVVQILLNKDVDVNAQAGRYGTALQAASFQGWEKIVQMLLGKDVDVDAQAGRYGTALQAASFRGWEKIVQMLLDKDVDVNAQGGFFGNALQAASRRGHKEIVQMLLDKDADANAQDRFFGNALQAASRRDHKGIIQMLLDRGASKGESVGVHYGNKEKSPGRKAFGTLPSLASLASAYPSQERSDKAKILQMQVIKGHEKAWGSKMSRSLSTNRRRVDTESDTE